MNRRLDPSEPIESTICVDRQHADELHQQIYDQFARPIKRGDFKPHDPLPGASALSRHLGVSHLTVRKAFDRLSDEGLTYRVQGKGTFVGESAGKPVIGIVMHFNYQPQAHSQEVHAAMAEHLVRLIEADGYTHRTLLLTTPRQDMYAERWNDHDRELLESADLRGVYLVNPGIPSWFIERCAADGVPVVSLNVHRPDVPHVNIADPRRMLDQAGPYLRERGRQHPAIIFLDTTPGGHREYAQWLGRTLKKKMGLTTPIQTVGVRQPTAHSGQAAATQLLRESPDLDCILCLDDVLNTGVCWAAAIRGVRVPDQILLISHANKNLTPPFPLPVARLECDAAAGVEQAHHVMLRLLNEETIQGLLTTLEPRLIPEHIEQDQKVEMYTEAV